MAGRTETTLSRQWVDTHLRALLDQLEWEADAGWRTVTDPQDCPQPVRLTAEVIRLRHHRHLWAVA